MNLSISTYKVPIFQRAVLRSIKEETWIVGQGQQSLYTMVGDETRGWLSLLRHLGVSSLRGYHVSHPNHIAVLANTLLIHLLYLSISYLNPVASPSEASPCFHPNPGAVVPQCFPPQPRALPRGHLRAGPQPLRAAWGMLLPLHDRKVFPTSGPIQPCQHGTLREEVVPIMGLKSTGPTPHPLPTSQPRWGSLQLVPLLVELQSLHPLWRQGPCLLAAPSSLSMTHGRPQCRGNPSQ